MTNKRAIEILNPEHREHYDSIEIVNEACRMGMKALEYRTPKKPYSEEKDDLIPVCPNCGESKGLYNLNGSNDYCSNCGQAIDWS